MGEIPTDIICNRCHKTKQEVEFSFRTNRVPPVQRECRECQHERYLERKARGKVVMPKRAKLRHLKGRTPKKKLRGTRKRLPPWLKATLYYLIIRSKLSLWAIAERSGVSYWWVRMLYKEVQEWVPEWTRRRVYPRRGLITRRQYGADRFLAAAKRLVRIYSHHGNRDFCRMCFENRDVFRKLFPKQHLTAHQLILEEVKREWKREQRNARKSMKDRKLEIRRYKRDLERWEREWGQGAQGAENPPRPILRRPSKVAPLPEPHWGITVSWEDAPTTQEST